GSRDETCVRGAFIALAWRRPGEDARAATIRFRWSRVATEMPACYKHSAPLEPGGDAMLGGLQTFGSAGAGWRRKCLRATNIRLRWSRVERMVGGLQTFGSAGGGGRGCSACYKHSAPLEPGGGGDAGVRQTVGSAGAGWRRKCLRATNIRLRWSRAEMDARGATIRLRWSRAEMEMPACYKHSAPLEPGGDGNACVLQTFGSAGAGR